MPHYSFPRAPASASIAIPLPTLEATIVLPDFFRSCSADGTIISAVILSKTANKSGQRPDRKAGRAYGGNAGLAFAMCAARKRRKNRQGGLKLFSVLIFCYFLIKQKVK
ncbi:MAG: hypothetical protein ACXVB6_05920 [Mucilaginibacter sp.]